MKFYLTIDGLYYQGDQASIDDIEVTQRPSPAYKWLNGTWVIDGDIVSKMLENSVQVYLDSKALSYGYDSASRCISYLNSTNPKWKAEAAAMNQWRDDVWAHCTQVQTDVKAGTRTIPTEADLIAELPKLVMPT